MSLDLCKMNARQITATSRANNVAPISAAASTSDRDQRDRFLNLTCPVVVMCQASCMYSCHNICQRKSNSRRAVAASMAFAPETTSDL